MTAASGGVGRPHVRHRPIVRPIASNDANRARNLLQQGTDLRAVIDILAGQLGAMISPVSASTPIWSFSRTDAPLRHASRPATHRDHRA